MRSFVVYESMFGNTARIARAVVDGLQRYSDVEVHAVDAGVWPAGVDLLVVGGPTHAFSMSRSTTRDDAVSQGATADPTMGLREWLDDLDEGHETPFAAFDTRADIVRHMPGSAARAAAKQVRKLGYHELTRPESFYVEDVPGPLLEGEEQRAKLWGSQLAELLVSGPRDWE